MASICTAISSLISWNESIFYAIFINEIKMLPKNRAYGPHDHNFKISLATLYLYIYI